MTSRRRSAAPLRVPAFQEADLPLAWLVRDCEFRRCRVLRGELAGMSLDGGDAAPVTLALLPPARLVMRLSREAHAVCGLDARRAAGDESAYIVDVDLRAVGERAAGRLAACFERLLPIARMRLAWVGTDEPGADPLAQRALVGEALCAGGVAVRQLAGVVAPALGPEWFVAEMVASPAREGHAVCDCVCRAQRGAGASGRLARCRARCRGLGRCARWAPAVCALALQRRPVQAALSRAWTASCMGATWTLFCPRTACPARFRWGARARWCTRRRAQWRARAPCVPCSKVPPPAMRHGS